MSLPLAFHPDVHGEVDDAYRWYEQRQTGLGDDFLLALDEVFDRLQKMPEAHQVIYRDVRRALPRLAVKSATILSNNLQTLAAPSRKPADSAIGVGLV